MDDEVALHIVNGAPGASIRELQGVVDGLGLNTAVINSAMVKPSDVPLLKEYLDNNNSLIVFVQMRQGPSTPEDPSGHFIGFIKHKPNTLEIYDPAGEDVLQYLNEPLEELAGQFSKIQTMDVASQPEGSNSCGPWTILRILQKAQSKQNFENSISKAGAMAQVNRNDTLQAFGPIGREKPHMSALRAQSYAEFLQEHTNLNEAAAKHVAHVINRGVAQDAEVARSTVAELMRGLQKAIPSMQVSDLFLDEYGGAAAGDFNEFVKTRKAKRGAKSPADAALKGGALLAGKAKRGGALLAGRPKRGGATLGGASLGGALLGGASCGCDMKPQTAKDREDERRGMEAYWKARHGGKPMKRQTAKDREDERRAMEAYWKARHGGALLAGKPMKRQTAKDREDERRAMEAYWAERHAGMRPQTAEDREHESEGMRRWWHDREPPYHQTEKDCEDERRAMEAYWAERHAGMRPQTAKDRADERRGEERYVARKTSLLKLMK